MNENDLLFGNDVNEAIGDLTIDVLKLQQEIKHLKALVLKTNADHMAVYRRLAAAELSAQQGWARYEAANKAHLSLQMRFAGLVEDIDENK